MVKSKERGLLLAENLQRARCSPVVFSKGLTARAARKPRSTRMLTKTIIDIPDSNKLKQFSVLHTYRSLCELYM